MRRLLSLVIPVLATAVVFLRAEDTFAQTRKIQEIRAYAEADNQESQAEDTGPRKRDIGEVRAYAEANDQKYQLELAKAYLAGEIVPRDRVSAYCWFTRAATSRWLDKTSVSKDEKARADEAKAEIRKLEKVLTATQVAEAEAMNRAWEPKEVLGSDVMKRAFANAFNLMVLYHFHFAHLVTGKLDRVDREGMHFQNWSTRVRFPGNTSYGCDASIGDQGDKADIFRCSLFHSLDIDRARAVFTSVERYVGDLLPPGWYRADEKPADSVLGLDVVCFSSEPRPSWLPDNAPFSGSESFALVLHDTDMVLGYYVYLESYGCRSKNFTKLDDRPAHSESSSADRQAELSDGSVSTSNVRGEIDEIARSGRFATLPPAQPLAATSSAQPSLKITNQTAYSLTVMMDGPAERSVTVFPGGTQTLVLPAGSYRVLGRVAAPNVLPFFGTQQYSAGTSYQESFYLGSR